MYISGANLRDRDWVKNAFFLTNSTNLADQDNKNQFFSSAMLKFTDSSLGGNECINPVPQFTPAADPRVSPVFADANGEYIPSLFEFENQGVFYSEAFDDSKQIVNIRFGFPKYNSLTTFFTGFYNSEAGRMARTGRSNSMFYTFGRVLGCVGTIAVFPIVLLGIGAHALGWLMGRRPTKYFYLKPAMAVYWTTVTNIVNQLNVNEGLTPRVFSDEAKKAMGEEYTFSKAELEHFAALMPDVFRNNGTVDVYAVANKAQRMARRRQKLLDEALKNHGVDLKKIFETVYKQDVSRGLTEVSLLERQTRWYKSVYGEEIVKTEKAEDGTETNVSTATDMVTAPTYKDGKLDESSVDKSWWSKFVEMLKADLDDGAEFAVFRVDATNNISSSFTNSTVQSEIQSKFNGTSSSTRETNFSFANGNIIGGAVGKIIEAGKDVVEGVLDSMQISGLVALAGGAFVDIPEHWDSSTASLSSTTYSFKLISPYNNPISRMINITIPMSMLIAGALPISTGPQSFTSPMLCEYYDKGRGQSRLGIIDSLSFNRGTSNLAFANGKALAIDVSFSIKDLSSVVHMPISGGETLNPSKAFFTDDNAFTDYLAVLAGMGLSDQIYNSNILKLRLTKQMAAWRNYFSPGHFAHLANDTGLGRIASAVFKGIQR